MQASLGLFLAGYQKLPFVIKMLGQRGVPIKILLDIKLLLPAL